MIFLRRSKKKKKSSVAPNSAWTSWVKSSRRRISQISCYTPIFGQRKTWWLIEALTKENWKMKTLKQSSSTSSAEGKLSILAFSSNLICTLALSPIWWGTAVANRLILIQSFNSEELLRGPKNESKTTVISCMLWTSLDVIKTLLATSYLLNKKCYLSTTQKIWLMDNIHLLRRRVKNLKISLKMKILFTSCLTNNPSFKFLLCRNFTRCFYRTQINPGSLIST